MYNRVETSAADRRRPTSEQWREWPTRYRIYATATDHECMKIFEVAGERAADVNDRELTRDTFGSAGIDEPVYPANQLHESLIFSTIGEAEKIVTNVDDSIGADCERTDRGVTHDTDTLATAGEESHRTCSNDGAQAG